MSAENGNSDHDDGGDELLHEEADVHFEPIVRLEAVEVKTLEEDEDPLFHRRARLYRFDNKSSEWKERGTGDLKFLQHKDSKVIRVLMRREKTLKICANHRVSSHMTLQPHQGSNRTWMYTCLADFSDAEPEHVVFAVRFKDKDDCDEFRKAFEEAKKHNAALAGNDGSSDEGAECTGSGSGATVSSSDEEYESTESEDGGKLAGDLAKLGLGKDAEAGT